jgi:phosphoserine phosphatase RsbU/P
VSDRNTCVLFSPMLAAEDTRAFIKAYALFLEATGLHGAALWLTDGPGECLYAALPLRKESIPDRSIPTSLDDLPKEELPLVVDDLLVGILTVDSKQVAAAQEIVEPLAAVLLVRGRHDRATRESSIMRGQLAGITAAGQLLRHLNLDTLLVNVLETAMQGVGAQVGALLTVDDNGRLGTRVTWGMREEHVGAIKLRDGSALTEQVLNSGKVLLIPADKINLDLDTSELQASLTSLLALPLGVGERRRGVVLLANPATAFSASAQRLAETVCGMAAIAIDNAILVRSAVDQQRLQSEMDLARQVQMGMYPTEGLKHGPVSIAGLARPCTETGGDYYTFVERKGRLLAMIGDVSGHGLGAALYTTTAHAVLHQQLRSDAGAGSAIRVLNESLHSSRSGRFMTAAIVEIDPETMRFSYHSAGHNPLLWIHKGELRWLESTAMPLGILPENPSEAPPDEEFASGDVLILYTDGITEAADQRGELFGESRLAESIEHVKGGGPDEQIAAVLRALDAFTIGAPVNDDITLVAITIA